MNKYLFWLIVATSVIVFLGVVTLYDVIKSPQFGPIIWAEKQDYKAPELSDEDKAAIGEINRDEHR